MKYMSRIATKMPQMERKIKMHYIANKMDIQHAAYIAVQGEQFFGVMRYHKQRYYCNTHCIWKGEVNI